MKWIIIVSLLLIISCTIPQEVPSIVPGVPKLDITVNTTPGLITLSWPEVQYADHYNILWECWDPSPPPQSRGYRWTSILNPPLPTDQNLGGYGGPLFTSGNILIVTVYAISSDGTVIDTDALGQILIP